MPTFERGDVVRVPFPYTDRPVRQHRPALVVSAGRLGPEKSMLWVAMITSASNRNWPLDIPIIDHEASGLPAPSVIRPVKLATIEARHCDRLGRVAAEIDEAANAATMGLLTTGMPA